MIHVTYRWTADFLKVVTFLLGVPVFVTKKMVPTQTGLVSEKGLVSKESTLGLRMNGCNEDDHVM